MLTLTHIAGFGGGIAAPDIIAPTITSSNTASVAENVTLAKSLTADEPVTWSTIGGADQARFEISGSTLRWLSNGTKNFEAPDDADTNNTYIVDVRATDTALNTTDQTITVTVTDVVESVDREAAVFGMGGEGVGTVLVNATGGREAATPAGLING